MSTQLRTRMILDLEGGYAATVKAWDQATQKFLSGTHASLGVAQRAWGVFGGKIDGIGDNFWARVAGAGGLALAARQVGSFDESMTRIGINANASAGQVAALKQQIFDFANRPDIKVRIDDLAAGVAGIVERTGDLKFATDNIENLGHIMQATGDSADDIGELIGNMKTFGVEAPGDILKVVDAWEEMGKQSGMSLKSFINNGQQVLTLYQQMGRSGPQALKEVGALMALATKQLGSPRRAASASSELLEGLRQNLGVTYGLGITDMSGHLQMPLQQALDKIITTFKGNAPALQRIFGQEGETLLTPLLNEYKSGKPLDALNKYLDVTADGSGVVNDSARAAREAAEGVNTLTNSWERFENKDLSKPLKEIGDALDKMDPDKVEKGLKAATYAAGGLLAIYGTRKAIGFGKDVWNVGKYIFGGKKAGGILGDVEGMAGVQRVWVVNMPGGGLGGSGFPGGSGAGGKVLKGLGGLGGIARFGMAAAGEGMTIGEIASTFGIGAAATLATGAAAVGGAVGGTAGYLGYRFGMQDNASGDFAGKTIAALMAFLGSDTARDAIYQRSVGDNVADSGRMAMHESNINLKLSFDRYGMPIIRGAQSDSSKLNLRTVMYGGNAVTQP